MVKTTAQKTIPRVYRKNHVPVLGLDVQNLYGEPCKFFDSTAFRRTTLDLG